jgi:excisionase family DNA binding protein
MEKLSALMGVEDVARALNISPYTVRRWASLKKLHRIKLGSRILFDPSDVAHFVEQARNASKSDDNPTDAAATTGANHDQTSD